MCVDRWENKCLKRGKASGSDGIMNEVLMYGRGSLVEGIVECGDEE